MKYLYIYIKSLIKYLIITTIISGIIIFIFPNTFTLIVALLLFIGCFPAASKDVKLKKMNDSKIILDSEINIITEVRTSFENEKLKEQELVEKINPIKEEPKERSIFETVDLD